MLVLSRKEGEQLLIGDDVVITFTKCGRRLVTIGIDAPQDVHVLRAELATKASPEEPVPQLLGCSHQATEVA